MISEDTFGTRLVLYRKKKNLKQNELAELAGITPTALNYYEKNKREPNVAVIKKLANVLEVSGDELLGLLVADEINSEPKLKQVSKNQSLSDIHKKAIMQVEKMTEEQIKAVLAFIGSLNEVEKSLKESLPKESSSTDIEFSKDIDIEAALAAYREELEAEKRGQLASQRRAKKEIG